MQRFFEMPGMPGGDDRARRAVRRRRAPASSSRSDGYILTNNHVVDGATKVTVRLLDRREFPARVVGTDPTTDVAVLKIDASGLTPAPFGDSDASRVGEWVLAVGNPLGENLTFTVTQGIISAKGRALDLPNRSQSSIQDFIQTDAAINPGNSGGPLVNVRGEVIGINSAIASPTGVSAGYGFAVPINLARAVMEQIRTNGRVERAALGVLVRDATTDDAAYVGLERQSRRAGAGLPERGLAGEARRPPGGRRDHQRRRPQRGLRGAAPGGDRLPEAGRDGRRRSRAEGRCARDRCTSRCSALPRIRTADARDARARRRARSGRRRRRFHRSA